MGRKRQYFFDELRKQYSTGFVIVVAVLLLVILSPIILISHKIRFDPSQFANLYLSTIFTSILLAFILQMLELYKTSLNSYLLLEKNIFAFASLLSSLKEDIEKGHEVSKIYGVLLPMYLKDIEKEVFSRTEFRGELLLLCKNENLEYILISLDESRSDAQNQALLGKVNQLLRTVSNIKI